MRIIIARRRIFGTLPHLEYRVFVPFDQLSPERQNLIHTRSDYGVIGGPWARSAEVLAPIAHLRSPPGSTRYHAALQIAALAKRIDTILVKHIFREMTAASLPLVFQAAVEYDDQIVGADVDELTGRYVHLASSGELSAETLGVRYDRDARTL